MGLVAALDAVGVISVAAMVEAIGMVTKAASVGAVGVDLEAGVVTAFNDVMKAASEDVVGAILGAGFINKAALGVWLAKESDIYQGVSLAGVEHISECAVASFVDSR